MEGASRQAGGSLSVSWVSIYYGQMNVLCPLAMAKWKEKCPHKTWKIGYWSNLTLLITQWYNINTGAVEPEAAELFLQLDSSDAETQVFLERCQERSDAVFTQLFHLVARTLLAPFVSQTSINGWVLSLHKFFPLHRCRRRRLLPFFFFFSLRLTAIRVMNRGINN